MKREIVPIVRRIPLDGSLEGELDLNYWLSQPPIKRLEAVTFIICQSMEKGQRLDKTSVYKRKMKP